MTKKRVPQKNIKPIILDVQKPNFNYEHLLKFSTINLSKVPQNYSSTKTFKKVLTVVLVCLLIGLFTFTFISWLNIKKIQATLEKNGPQIVSNFSSFANSFKNLENATASSYLENNSQTLANINKLLNDNFGGGILNVFGNFVPLIKNGTNIIQQIGKLNMNLIVLSNLVNDLKNNGLSYFQNNGKALIDDLENIKKYINETNNESRDLEESLSQIKNFGWLLGNIDINKNEYLKYSTELYGLENVLENLISILKSNTPHHIAILFQNPSEIRPGGGFIGSYAHLTVFNGQMQDLEVRDIYDPDGQLDIKVVPPKELQATTPNWGARDANWFFDFPTSAKTVLNFLSASKMYSEKNIKFDEAIGINVNVVSSLLKITGPISITGYPTINSDNFLYEVEKEKQLAKANNEPYPKKILQVLTPIILEKLKNLNDDQKQKLFDILKYHLDKKDIMLYSTNVVLENFFNNANVGGAVYSLPQDFWGNYLAVVNANIAGGKSDAFIKEDVNANIDTDTLGNVFTTLYITRTHNGNEAQESWWRATNNDFLQVFTEPNANLVDVSGNDYRKKYSTLDYANLDYAINPDLAAIQSNELFISNSNVIQRKEFDKNVFGMWIITPLGESKTLKVRYQTTYPHIKVLMPGQKYTFVFEKQSGVQNSLELTINAPFKYFWQETNSPTFTYENSNPDKRIIIQLTLGYNNNE
jgi:hypothetical protein